MKKAIKVNRTESGNYEICRAAEVENFDDFESVDTAFVESLQNWGEYTECWEVVGLDCQRHFYFVAA